MNISVDPETGKITHGFVIMSGKPKSGKTHLLKYIVYQHRYTFDRIIMATPSIFSDPEDVAFLDSRGITFPCGIDEIIDIYNEQMMNSDKSLLLILEDMLDQIDMRNKVWGRLISTHRHINCSLIITTQYMKKSCSPVMRNMITEAFIFRDIQHESVKAIAETFSSELNVWEMKKLIADNLPKGGHYCLHYSSTRDEDFVLYLAPAYIPKFIISYQPRKEKSKLKGINNVNNLQRVKNLK